MATPFEGDPVMDDLKAKAEAFLKRYTKLSEQYLQGMYSDDELWQIDVNSTEWVNETFCQAKWAWMTANDSAMHAMYERGQKMESLQWAKDQFEKLSTDEAMLTLEVNKHPEQIEEERNQIEDQINELRNQVFSWIVTCCKWTDRQDKDLREMFDSEMVDSHTKQLLVAAVMLSDIEFFESQKTALLYYLFHKRDMAVAQRALVSLVMVSILHRNDEQMRDIIVEFSRDKERRMEILDIQKVMHLMQNVVQDSQKAMGQMLKGIFTNATIDMADQINEEGILEMDIEIPLDSEDECKNELKSMLDSQEQGVDIYYCQFKDLKKIGFFHSLYNWFMPYYYENSALKSVRDKMAERETLFKVFPYITNMCDSDIYTMLLSSGVQSDVRTLNLDNVECISEYPENYEEPEEDEEYDEEEEGLDEEQEADEFGPTPMGDGHMQEILRKKLDEMSNPDRVMSMTEILKEEKELRHKYIHDLFRFYRLSPMKNTFEDPFLENSEEPFLTSGYYSHLDFNDVRLSLSRFAARRKDYLLLDDLLQLVYRPTAEQKLMQAMVHYGYEKYEKTIDICNELIRENGQLKVYLQLLLDSHVALNNKEEVVRLLRTLQEMEQDADAKMQYQLSELDFYLSHNYEKDALSLAYVMDNDHPKEEQVECRLAEALMYSSPCSMDNLNRAKNLLAPYINDFRKELTDMGCFEKPEDPEDMKRKMAAMFSVMVNRFGGNVDKKWECRKKRAFGLCLWVTEGAGKAMSTLGDSFMLRDRENEFGTPVYQFTEKELDFLCNFDIMQSEVYLMTEQFLLSDIQLGEYGR